MTINSNQNWLARYLKHEGLRVGEIIAYGAWHSWPFFAEGRALFNAVCRLDLEGIVAKRLRDPYNPKTKWFRLSCPHRPRPPEASRLRHHVGTSGLSPARGKG